MKWVELQLELSPELVEPVSEFISRHVPEGLSISPKNQLEFPDLLYVLSAWLPADGQLKKRQQAIAEGLWHLSRIRPIQSPVYREIDEVDWRESWKVGYRPINVGERLQVVPSWAQPTERGRIPVMIEHGMAFGTGTHPTTRLCLLAMEKHLSPGDILVDIGTGTGILSIAGILLGAERAVAADVDREAVEAALGNCTINGVSGQVELIHGSIDDVREHLQRKGIAPSCCLVNMVEKGLLELLQRGLNILLPPGGKFIISGLLLEQLQPFIERVEDRGFVVDDVLQEGEWQAVVLRSA